MRRCLVVSDTVAVGRGWICGTRFWTNQLVNDVLKTRTKYPSGRVDCHETLGVRFLFRVASWRLLNSYEYNRIDVSRGRPAHPSSRRAQNDLSSTTERRTECCNSHVFSRAYSHPMHTNRSTSTTSETPVCTFVAEFKTSPSVSSRLVPSDRLHVVALLFDTVRSSTSYVGRSLPPVGFSRIAKHWYTSARIGKRREGGSSSSIFSYFESTRSFLQRDYFWRSPRKHKSPVRLKRFRRSVGRGWFLFVCFRHGVNIFIFFSLSTS